MLRFLSVTFLFIYFSVSTFANNSPKRELRAAWIATVGNIDWPSKQGLTAQQQQQEFINHLNFLRNRGFNAVIVQVRPAADVFWDSDLEPWSRYLSGKQGQAPFPKYDPMEFMIKETHKRNMEFHAWFNPYRALTSTKSNPNPPSHPTKKHPEWIINYDNKAYFDPGNVNARQHIIKVIMEAVSKYDIDAVHIDDYFYPYPVAGKKFNDDASFQQYGNNSTLADWRRSNVNTFIWQLNNNIKKEKPWVKFGVSPFGVWRNIDKDPRGSNTKGATACYDDLYSDVMHWMDKNWIDYVAPQLYWEHGHRVAPYDVLLPWWAENSQQTDLYIGLGVYRMTNAMPGTKYFGPYEILKQIEAGRKQKVQGFVMYSMISFSKIGNALADSLQYNYFGNIAIPPAFKVPKVAQPLPPQVTAQKTSNGVLLKWTNTANSSALGGTNKYLIYKFKEQEPIDLNQSQHIIALSSNKSFVDKEESKGYKYVITQVDRCWNESDASNTVQVQ